MKKKQKEVQMQEQFKEQKPEYQILKKHTLKEMIEIGRASCRERV